MKFLCFLCTPKVETWQNINGTFRFVKIDKMETVPTYKLKNGRKVKY